MDVAAWLRGLGLGQYANTFRESEIEADVLPELTEADLEKLGLPLDLESESSERLQISVMRISRHDP